MKNFFNRLGLLGWLLIATTAIAAGIGGSILVIGTDSLTGDVEIQMRDGRIKWNGTDNKLQFSNNAGSQYKNIGAGGGGGGGEGFNNAFTSDDNANFEDGLTGWTNSGGTFALETTDPLEGEQSANYTPSAQNDYVQGPLLDVDRDVFRGRACQAQIEYIGGDTNLELRILDAGGSTFKSLNLPAHSITATESIYFLCPSSTDISGDADLADLRLQIFNAGASASPLVKFDKAYLGTLIGLSESQVPDQFSAKIDTAGNVVSENVDWIDGNCALATSTFTCDFVSGLVTQAMSCRVVPVKPGSSDGNALVLTSSSTQLIYRTEVSATGAAAAYAAEIECSKQGADAKQAVQVYKSIPKVAENVNVFSAKIDCSGASTISDESVEWLDSIANISSGSCDVTINAGVFANTPNCAFHTDSGKFVYDGGASDNNTIDLVCINDGGGNCANFTTQVVCQKQGTDFNLPTVQPILVNQVQSGNQRGENQGSCFVENSGGTPSSDPSSTLCEAWVDSFTDNGVGNITINFVAGFFAEVPNCTVAASAGIDSSASLSAEPTVSAVTVETFISATGAAADQDFVIKCRGVR